MNVGIDMDGVLTDIHSFNARHAPRFFKRKFDRDVVDENPYDIRDIFKCSDEEHLKYWKKYLFLYVIFEPARNGAKPLTRRLRDDGHEVFIITKRVFSWQDSFLGKLMRFLIRNWVWRNGIYCKKIIFCDNDIHDSKKTACLENNIDVMIDDEPVNISVIAPVAKVICFNTSYNRDCSGENISRAYDMDEVYNMIKDLGN